MNHLSAFSLILMSTLVLGIIGLWIERGTRDKHESHPLIEGFWMVSLVLGGPSLLNPMRVRKALPQSMLEAEPL